MKRYFLLLIFFICSIFPSLSESYDIKNFYFEVSEKIALENEYFLEYDDRYFIVVKLNYIEEEQAFAEVLEVLDSKFCKLKIGDYEYYALFDYPIFLFKHDTGIIYITNDFYRAAILEITDNNEL